jgi:hypothetical protein
MLVGWKTLRYLNKSLTTDLLEEEEEDEEKHG